MLQFSMLFKGSAVLLLAATSLLHGAPNRPNIVLILADDVGVDAIGCYGGTSCPTPNIDALAKSGMTFRNAFSMPACHPTRVTLLTGRYPMTLGSPSWGTFPKSLETTTLTNYLRHHGYATAIAGKWQLGLLGSDLKQPNRMGFDRYCLFGWHEGPRYDDPLIWQDGHRRSDTANRYGPDVYVDYLIDFFEEHREKPFFALYSMALCHDVTDDLDAPVPYVPGKDRYLTFDEMVQSMDACVGRIMRSLDQLDLRSQTWVLFTADNGTARKSIVRAERNTDPNAKRPWKYISDPVFRTRDGIRRQGGKGQLTDLGTNVPLIVSRTDHLTGGQVVDDLVDCSDFLPTSLELIGAPPPADINGVSFAPRLFGSDENSRKWAFAEHKNHFWVRTQRYKLLSQGKLIDMRNNPHEIPLAQDELAPDVRLEESKLKTVLNQLKASAVPK